MVRSMASALKYSPPAWGWTAEAERYFAIVPVFPTRVGMDRR
ncbi:MAG: hypothetical protein E1N59_2991 [Puniceicoccaceae bacterium 5H]|nr:MAG: hypothetical protein E1N59_2991 [Puniceicoccaceae bacterium 5H]